MTPRPLLEIAANSLASALAAQEGGADRIELCSALELGGLTPSHAKIALARERLRIPIHVLIRPRAGDFVYDDAEIGTMLRDVEHCAAVGCEGVVIGVLDAHGNVAERACRELVAAAGTLGVTFHRAIDVSRDPASALEDIVLLGCERVLTSGAAATAVAGAGAIAALLRQASERIVVMPGAGIDATNVAALREATGACEFHASAKRELPSRRTGAAARAEDGMTRGEIRTDVDAVRAIVRALRANT